LTVQSSFDMREEKNTHTRLQDCSAKRCKFCLRNESERTEILPLIGFLPLKAVPLNEVRLYLYVNTRHEDLGATGLYV
jgi:hypothetical protein